VLIGDSIRLGYGPLVAEKLAGRVEVTGPGRSCGDSARVLERLDRWAIEPEPSLVHLNCGLHDLRRSHADGTYQVDIERYAANLREIVNRIQRETAAILVFATTTPVDDARHARRGIAFDRLEADVLRYNEVAVRVMEDAGVLVNDLHEVVVAGGPERLLSTDGTHLTPAGNETVAEVVAGVIARQLPASR
jgi:lysophospholipase L1-like esterase